MAKPAAKLRRPSRSHCLSERAIRRINGPSPVTSNGVGEPGAKASVAGIFRTTVSFAATPIERNLQAPPASTPGSRSIVMTLDCEGSGPCQSSGVENRAQPGWRSEVFSERAKAGCRSERPRDGMGLAPSLRAQGPPSVREMAWARPRAHNPRRSLRLRDVPQPHWFILSRGVPAATSSGRNRGVATVTSSGASVTGMLL